MKWFNFKNDKEDNKATQRKRTKRLVFKTEPKEIGYTNLSYLLEDGREVYSRVYGHVYQSTHSGRDGSIDTILEEPTAGELYSFDSLRKAKGLVVDLENRVITILDDNENPMNSYVGKPISLTILDSGPYIKDVQIGYIEDIV